MTETYQLIPIKDIQINPYQPRQHFNTGKLEELAQSIKENGIIQPLIVRPSKVVGFELMAGERRLRASQLAGLKEVPAIIKQLNDQEMMTHAIIENLQRHDLSPIEEARAYQNLIDKGNSHDAIAQVMGKSRPYISNMIRLLNLSDNVIEALEQNQISQAHARSLLTVTQTEQQTKWLDKIINEKISVHQLEKLLKQTRTHQQVNKKDPFIQTQEQDLSQFFGTSVQIAHTKQGQGHIKIDFNSLEEFDRIINTLKKEC